MEKMKYAFYVEKLRQDAIIPTKATEGSNAYDLYAITDAMIAPGETVKIGTGLAIKPPPYHAGFIFARSGLATKKGLRPANGVGVCDCDYTGEYVVALHNDSKKTQYVVKGDRIAQVAFVQTLDGDFIQVEKLEHTNRGQSGFGSTGK